MSATIHPFPAPTVITTCRLGGCPVCGDLDSYLHIGRTTWFVCSTHKYKWFVGDCGLTAGIQSSAERARTEAELRNYETVTPVMPERAEP